MKENSGSGQIIESEKNSIDGEDASLVDGSGKLPWVAPVLRSLEINATLAGPGSSVDGCGGDSGS